MPLVEMHSCVQDAGCNAVVPLWAYQHPSRYPDKHLVRMGVLNVAFVGGSDACGRWADRPLHGCALLPVLGYGWAGSHGWGTLLKLKCWISVTKHRIPAGVMFLHSLLPFLHWRIQWGTYPFTGREYNQRKPEKPKWMIGKCNIDGWFLKK